MKGPVRVYYMSDFGGDPTGQKDSTEHIQSLLYAAAGQGPSSPDAQSVISSAGNGGNQGNLSVGVPSKNGVADLQGGTYTTSKSIQVPNGGNLLVGLASTATSTYTSHNPSFLFNPCT